MKQFFHKKLLLLLLTLSLGILQGWGQISITSLPYAPAATDFNFYNPSSASNLTATLPTGWTASSSGTPAYNGQGTGSSATGGYWAYGAGSDFSLGALRSTTPGNITYSVSFVNNSGSIITSLTLSWDYKQWTYANTSGWDCSATGVLAGNTTINGKDFTGTATGTNGTATTTPIATFTVTGLSIANGQAFGLSWITTDAASSDNGVAIDNFSINASGPSTLGTDYFRSAQTGNWNDVDSWSSSPDNVNWYNATLIPDNNAAGIAIQNGDTITVTSDVVARLVNVTVGGTLTVNSGINLTINDDGSVATDLDINGIVNNAGTITPTDAKVIVESGGTFTCLSATPATSGAIGNVGSGNVVGNVTIQQNLTAQRAYRLLGHPFNASLGISNLQPYIDITGSGPGLTAGNSSAYSYVSGGWAPYTDNGQTWNKNEAIFVFVRGTPGEGVGTTNGSYTPSAPTISLTGQINTGNLNYNVKSPLSFGGTSQGWNAIGNPYPAPININTIGNISAPGGAGASIYVWNANKGSTGAGIASGGYDFYTLGNNIILPEYGAFFIKNTSGTDQVINFTESNKNFTTPPYVLFGAGTTPSQGFLLTIADANTYWDKLKISFDSKSSTASVDQADLDKFSNINLDFYSIGSDNKYLAINNRPFLQSLADFIPLGLKTNQQKTFTVKASDVNLSGGANLYFRDKYAGNWMKITDGMSYDFKVTADSASQGNDRFEIVMKIDDQPVVETPVLTKLTVEAGPNPVSSLLTIHYTSPQEEQTYIRITDINGKTVSNINEGKVQSGVQDIATGTWSRGVYILQVNNGKEVVTKKVVKE